MENRQFQYSGYLDNNGNFIRYQDIVSFGTLTPTSTSGSPNASSSTSPTYDPPLQQSTTSFPMGSFRGPNSGRVSSTPAPQGTPRPNVPRFGTPSLPRSNLGTRSGTPNLLRSNLGTPSGPPNFSISNLARSSPVINWPIHDYLPNLQQPTQQVFPYREMTPLTKNPEVENFSGVIGDGKSI